MAIVAVSKQTIIRWGARTLFVNGGGYKDGFVATCILEIVYEASFTD